MWWFFFFLFITLWCLFLEKQETWNSAFVYFELSGRRYIHLQMFAYVMKAVF